MGLDSVVGIFGEVGLDTVCAVGTDLVGRVTVVGSFRVVSVGFVGGSKVVGLVGGVTAV